MWSVVHICSFMSVSPIKEGLQQYGEGWYRNDTIKLSIFQFVVVFLVCVFPDGKGFRSFALAFPSSFDSSSDQHW